MMVTHIIHMFVIYAVSETILVMSNIKYNKACSRVTVCVDRQPTSPAGLLQVPHRRRRRQRKWLVSNAREEKTKWILNRNV